MTGRYLLDLTHTSHTGARTGIQRVVRALHRELGSAAIPVTHDPFLWAVWIASVVGSWLITLMVNLVIGCASFFLESSLKLMDVWLVLFFVLSGYLIPVDLFPPALHAVVVWLPFRFQIGFPVEVAIGVHDRAAALALLGAQWTWAAVGLAATIALWRGGLRRFAAYGG